MDLTNLTDQDLKLLSALLNEKELSLLFESSKPKWMHGYLAKRLPVLVLSNPKTQ